MRKNKKKSGKNIEIGIKVLGVGGSGGNIINRMYKSKISGIDFFSINTDLQALKRISGPKKIQIGRNLTKGLGTGMNPTLGKQAAEESREDLEQIVKDAQMIFITCGLGGGTGSGAAPVIAEIAKNLGILTVAVVTLPFSFEGGARREIAEKSFEDLKMRVDTLITISNDRLLDVVDKNKTLLESFSVADDVLKNAIIGISEIILLPGLINIDFADVKTIMENSGQALMGIGRSSGDDRAILAAQQAFENPLLDLTLAGAKGILFLMRGGKDLTLHEVNEAAKIITQNASEETKIIFGAVIDENLKDQVEITVIASNFLKGGEKKEFIPLNSNRENIFEENFRKIPKEINEIKTKEEEELEVPAFLRKKIKL